MRLICIRPYQGHGIIMNSGEVRDVEDPVQIARLIQTGCFVPAQPTAETFDATPAALDLARKTGVDLSQIKGSGAGGKITVGDVRSLLGDQEE